MVETKMKRWMAKPVSTQFVRHGEYWVRYPHPSHHQLAIFVARGAFNSDDALDMFNSWCQAK